MQCGHGSRRGIRPGFPHSIALESRKNVLQEIDDVLFLADGRLPALVADNDAADCLDVVGLVPRGDNSLEGSKLKCYTEPAPLRGHDTLAVTLAEAVDAAKKHVICALGDAIGGLYGHFLKHVFCGYFKTSFF